MNVDQRDYVKAAGDTAGLRLTVHSADRLSFPEVEGLTISAGHTTSIRLRKVVTNALCLVIITLTAVWERSIVISVSVCLSVLFDISATTRPNFAEFYVHVACGRGSVLP